MKLNRYFSSLCVGLTIVGTTSCSDFLTEYPTNNENVPNYYKTETDIEQGVNAAYAALASRAQYGASYIYMMELRSDISSVGSLTNSGGIYGDVYLFRESPYNSVLNDTWVGCYETVKRCNVVLDRIDGVAMDDSKRNQYQGEMLFIRALTHFNLVRLWGDVPLATHYYDAPFDALKEGRTPKAEVYRQIEADLRDATNATFLKTLDPEVVILQSWSSDHPGQEVAHRLISPKLGSHDRKIFMTDFDPLTGVGIGPWFGKKLSAANCHILLRVHPDGTYTTYTVQKTR